MPHNVISPESASRGLVDGILPACKKWGETPLETLGRIREAIPELAAVPLSYAGRLDPLAEGLMLVLCGEANKDREAYLGMDKEYEFEILFGLKTDTGDLLGLITGFGARRISKEALSDVIRKTAGEKNFPYPVFSSKAVEGKPLFQWFKEGKIGEIQIPTVPVLISRMELVSLSVVSGPEVLEKIRLAAATVKGDFRQEEILASADEAVAHISSRDLQVAKIRMASSSGTYVRTVAEKIGAALGMPALAYSIVRTKVGEFTIDDVVAGK